MHGAIAGVNLLTQDHYINHKYVYNYHPKSLHRFQSLQTRN